MEKILNELHKEGGARPKSSIRLPQSSAGSQKHQKKVKFKDLSTTSINSQGDAKQTVNRILENADNDEADELIKFGTNRVTGNIYSKPEINSTLLLAEKLQSLHAETFNEKEAVRRKLKQCEKTKKRIINQSVKHVNIPKSVTIFKDLIPLEFNEQSFLRVAAEERAEKWKHIMPKSAPKDPEPNVEDFLTPENQPEYVTMSAPLFNFQHLRTVSIPSTINRLYIHRRKWENVP